MSAVTVDASVWIAAQDSGDVFCEKSRLFLFGAAARESTVYVPAFAKVEVACALARKLKDPDAGRRLTAAILEAAKALELEVDSRLLQWALVDGTTRLLRGADALYAGAAALTGSLLVSWDGEHLERAGALSPSDWLDANPLSSAP